MPDQVRHDDQKLSAFLNCDTDCCAEMTDAQYISKKLLAPLCLTFASNDGLCAVPIRRSVELEDFNLLPEFCTQIALNEV